MPMPAHRGAAALAALGAALAPAAAHANPTLTPDRACYAAGWDLMKLTGAGFTPAAEIDLLLAANGKLGDLTVDADATGAFTVGINAPTLKDFGAKPPRFSLGVTANDQSKFGPDGPIGPPEEAFAPASVTISDWGADVAAWDTRRPVARRGRRIAVRAIGWTTAGQTLYVHYLRAGKDVHTEPVGPLTGACGNLTKRIKTFAFRGAKPGRYKVRFSASPTWSPRQRWAGYEIRLR